MSARTILNPPLINELNGIFNGSSSITAINVDATGALASPNLFLQNGADQVVLSCVSGTSELNVDGGVKAVGGITVGLGSTNTFLRFVSISTGWSGVPANSGVGAVADTLIPQENYQFDPTGTLDWTTLTGVFSGNCYVGGAGVLLIAEIALFAPTNGLTGYVNINFSFINTSNAEVVPTTCSCILVSY
jgi:hypothetical protein